MPRRQPQVHQLLRRRKVSPRPLPRTRPRPARGGRLRAGVPRAPRGVPLHDLRARRPRAVPREACSAPSVVRGRDRLARVDVGGRAGGVPDPLEADVFAALRVRVRVRVAVRMGVCVRVWLGLRVREAETVRVLPVRRRPGLLLLLLLRVDPLRRVL